MENGYTEFEYLDEFSPEIKPKTKSNCKRLANFSNSQIKKLIEAVKDQLCIWDLQSKEHCNINAINRSWIVISQGVGKKLEECQIAWKSLREAYWYHARASNKKKSGSSGGKSLTSPSFNDDVDAWEFATDLSFLKATALKRRTFQSAAIESNSCSTSDTSPNKKNYSYDQPAQKKFMHEKNAAILKMLETQKDLLASQTSMEMVHTPFWAYLDDLTKDFNQHQMRDLQQNILQMVFAKIAEN